MRDIRWYALLCLFLAACAALGHCAVKGGW